MKKYLYIALAALGMMGCEEELDRVSSGSGFLISLGETSVEVTTKAASEDFRLVVTKDGISEPAYEGDLTSGDTRFVPVSAGTYEIKATSKSWTDNTLISPNPYYAADTTDVEITEGDAQKTITLTAKYGCALASVVFPEAEEMAKVFKNYYVKVQVGGSSMKLSSADTKAYFKANTEVSFYFGGTKQNGEEVEEKQLTSDQLPSTFNAADYCKITLQMNDNLLMDIAKVEEKTVGITEEIPLDWLPKPKVVAEGFDDNNTLTFVETEAKTPKLNLELSHALQDIRFKFNFQDEQFADLLQADKEYLLSTDKEAIEQVLGISLPSIGSESASIDFAPLVAKLQTNAGTSTTNTMTIVPKANNRWSSEESQVVVDSVYTFVCNKPEFTVAVQPGNCWSREFTVDEVTVISGNVNTIKNNLVYQYYNGQEWIDCATRENIKGRTQQFTEAAEDLTTKEYEVRALYRGAIASSVVTATLETPTQLPNGNMDDWNYETYIKDGGWFNDDETFYSFNPWRNGDNPFWDTNNDFTTRHRNNVNVNIYHYNGFHAVSSVQGRSSRGLAAELRSTANGRGNNEITGQVDYNKVAGELFIGSAIVKMGTSGMFGDADGSKDTYEREKNATFTNRPSALKLWYKYVPYNSDTWSAHIELLDEAKNVIIQKDFTSSETKNDWTEAIVSLDYNEGMVYKKCKYIYVIFSSTTNSGANMPYREITQTFYVDGQAKTFDRAYVGSVLTIDDISLVYDK